jgi:hypothetical protein
MKFENHSNFIEAINNEVKSKIGQSQTRLALFFPDFEVLLREVVSL